MSASGLHNQKRTETTVNEQNLKRKKDARLIAEYTTRCNQLHEMRINEDYSAEALRLNTRVASENPEFYTVWNYRREILQDQISKMFILLTRNSDETQKLLQGELPLIDSLLKVVPKSYWVWNHRRWILENCPNPLWKTELKIINYMLNLDARNFHGWDYRRYVVQKSQIVSPLEEFNYTTEKIHQNFSNFSAWHYRSKMLPLAFPDQESFMNQVKSDVELVRNAIFTEPKDQSAWLYQRFLCGKKPDPVKIVQICAYRSGQLIQIAILFNQNVKCVEPKNIIVSLPEVEIDYRGMKSNSNIQVLSFRIPQGGQIGISVKKDTFEGSSLTLRSSEFEFVVQCTGPEIENLPFIQHNEGSLEVSTNDLVDLKVELEQLTQLAELEPDCKCILINAGVLLTLVYFYERLNFNTNRAIEILDQLMKNDPYRLNYYKDHRKIRLISGSRLVLHERLSTFKGTEIDLSNLSLSVLLPSPVLMEVVNLSLSSNVLNNLSFTDMILGVQELNLDSNYLSSLDGIEKLTHLRRLSAKHNRLRGIESVRALKGLKLDTIDLDGNELDESDIDTIKTRFSS